MVYKVYLQSFTLENFRKFGDQDNKVLFAHQELNDEMKDEELDISTATTLIIGKNNVGKTSIITALKKLEEGGSSFISTDFNFQYLKGLLKEYKIHNSNKSGEEKIALPEMSFIIKINLDDKKKNVVNIAPWLLLDEPTTAVIYIDVSVKEGEAYRDKVDNMLKNQLEKNQFKKLLDIIDEVGLHISYRNKEKEKIENFQMGDLIEIKSIEANKIRQKESLTKAFNKIIEYRYKMDKQEGKQLSEDISSYIEEINTKMTKKFKKHHQEEINQSLNKIEPSDSLTIQLTSNLTHSNILQNNSLVYEYVEKGLTIPESQYGLGYTNLVMIIAEIIEYIEKSPENSFSSTLNFISIEEPETFMHPQMQELFIRNINRAIEQLLTSRNKNVRSQIIITTHSSHILNSKIHTGNTFDYINYCTNIGENNLVVNLQDKNIVDENMKISDKVLSEVESLMFIKKHIKYKVSELFFSDAVIFVEGITEEILLKYWLERDQKLQYYYISVFNINGAYAHIYDKLIKQLKVPTLIITDLDIKMDKSENKKDKDHEQFDEEKETQKDLEDQQVSSLSGKTTTNNTLVYYCSKNLEELDNERPIQKENIFLTYQNKIEGFYPTSLEEAIILTNYQSDILKNAYRNTKPQVYNDNYKGMDKNLKRSSKKLHNSLKGSKSEFTNNLLIELLEFDNTKKDKETSDGQNDFKIPCYINKGFEWLIDQLKES